MINGPGDKRIETIRAGRIAPHAQYVLYWMQQSQRAEGNAALEHALALANSLGLPVVVGFALMPDYPAANARHYAFMLEGLRETERRLAARGIRLAARLGHPTEVIVELAHDAACVVWDKGYLRHQREWRATLGEALEMPIDEVDADCIVPVAAASTKAEYAARTIRPKILAARAHYLQAPESAFAARESLGLEFAHTVALDDVDTLLESLGLDASVAPAPSFSGGLEAARRRLAAFVASKLPGYSRGRNDPANPNASTLSPYLHFGQISAVEVALTVAGDTSASQADKEAFLEQLIVRRELAVNFVFYTPNYDTFECLPDWAKTTLRAHAGDPRETVYELDDLEAARTHDPYWNAAMKEMLVTGSMHGYMRMYWGKKIIEWTREPEVAYERALYLNNKHFLDGRDANSYASIAWLFGMHDRPWRERDIFGTVRYMNAAGLKRKFDIARYVERIESLAAPS